MSKTDSLRAGAVTASEAKSRFGAVLDRAMVEGRVAITKHDEVRAVLVSRRHYEELLGQRHGDELEDLAEEFDALVARMQTPRATAAGRALFDASPSELGRAALKRRG